MAQQLGFDSKGRAESFFGRLEKFRDRLAHAQDIVRGNWRDLPELVEKAEAVLDRLQIM